jgi:DnaA-homolog protein
MAQQLLLAINLKQDATFDNFYVGEHASLIETLTSCVLTASPQYVYCYGVRGVGCSHLLQACCHYADEQGLRAQYLPLSEFQAIDPSVLDALESMDLICVDDIHLIAKEPAWEEALFHLYNRVQAQGARLLIAANNLPKFIGFELADLTSRLASGLVFQLQALSDEDKVKVMILRAKNEGVSLMPEVATFILHHVPRNLADLMAALERVKHASLIEKRKLTVPFIKTVLKI